MMKDKKNIDRLFTERFKDFEATPNPEIWDRIKEKLKEEEDDRKIIPIWWRLAGVAALLALLLTAGKFVFFSDTATTDPVLVEESTSQDQMDQDNPLIVEPETQVVKASASDSKESSSINSNQSTEQTSEEDKSVQISSSETSSPLDNSLDSNAVTATKDNPSRSSSDNLNSPENNSKDVVTVRQLDEQRTTISGVAAAGDNNPTPKNPTTDVAPIEEKAPEALAESKQETSRQDLLENKLDAENMVQSELDTKEALATEEAKTEEDKPSILDAIEEQNEAIASVQQDVRQDRWEVTPNLAPVYYNSIGSGSSLDPSFADNPQTGDINMSYGVQIGYQVANRLTIRSGVSNVDLGYTTGGVELATGPASTALRSVNYGNQGNVLSAYDRGTIQPPAPGNMDDPLANLTPKSTEGNAEVIQNLSYFEVPMELKYDLLESRFGISMIGGFSTLILSDNEISVRDGDFRSTIGEANNLNDLSFSTNIGLGFNYKFSKQIRFVVEPMFKYQLNPYSDSSVSFQPYYLGVYSGLSFKF